MHESLSSRMASRARLSYNEPPIVPGRPVMARSGTYPGISIQGVAPDASGNGRSGAPAGWFVS